jgi:CheY-like chemotaxis protein
MDGYVVVRHLRTDPSLKAVVVAALTGYGDEQDRKRSKEAGFNYHFVKPISLPSLQELIGKLPDTNFDSHLAARDGVNGSIGAGVRR